MWKKMVAALNGRFRTVSETSVPTGKLVVFENRANSRAAIAHYRKNRDNRFVLVGFSLVRG
jgi:hypothetical protein